MKETLNLDIKSFCVYFEIETVDLLVPILCVQLMTDIKMEDWSKKVGSFKIFHDGLPNIIFFSVLKFADNLQ